jgi:hypothetical protein
MIGTSGSRIILTRNTAPDEHDHAVDPGEGECAPAFDNASCEPPAGTGRSRSRKQAHLQQRRDALYIPHVGEELLLLKSEDWSFRREARHSIPYMCRDDRRSVLQLPGAMYE